MSDVVYTGRPRIMREVVVVDQLMKDALEDVAPEPGQGLKEVISKTDFGLGVIEVVFNSGLGDFDYGEDGPQPGELPSNAFTQVSALTESSAPVFSLAFFEPLTFAELAALDTLAEFVRHFFSGDDSFRGGVARELLNGYGGADRIDGGGGDDDLRGGTGDDQVFGGLGNDTADGGAGADRVGGDDGNDRLLGGAGADAIGGGSGADALIGGAGNDSLSGDFGRDTLTGGAGADDFQYRTLSAGNPRESGVGSLRRDVITDFRPGVDDIDVSGILTEPFRFVGSGPLTGLGQIRARALGADTLVEVSTDADAQAELTILLEGRLRLTAGDFVL